MTDELRLSKKDQKQLSKVSALARELDGPDGGDVLDNLEVQELAWMLSWLVDLVNKGYEKQRAQS